MRAEVERYYGEMYFRILLILVKIGVEDRLVHGMATDILSAIKVTESEPDAAMAVSRVLGGDFALPADAHESRARYLAELVRPHVRGLLLDFGCGDGQVSVGLSEDTTLYDISDFRVPDARSTNFTSDWGRVAELAPFDTAIVLTVLHHCDEPDLVLDNITAVTHRVIIVESVVSHLNPGHVQSFVDWFWNRGLHPGVPIPVPGNFRTDEEWQKEFSRRGLSLAHHVDLGIDLPGAPEHHVLYVLDK